MIKIIIIDLENTHSADGKAGEVNFKPMFKHILDILGKKIGN